jgi:hypothetical protein
VRGGSIVELRAGSSGSSEESEWGVPDLCGDDCLWFDRGARSVRAEDTEDEDVLGAVATLPGGCVVRALDERRGDIASRAVAALDGCS